MCLIGRMEHSVFIFGPSTGKYRATVICRPTFDGQPAVPPLSAPVAAATHPRGNTMPALPPAQTEVLNELVMHVVGNVVGAAT